MILNPLLCSLVNTFNFIYLNLYKVLSMRTLLAGDVPGVCGCGARLPGGHVLQHLPLDAGPPPHRNLSITLFLQVLIVFKFWMISINTELEHVIFLP
jgi:hypothetical protein